MDQERVLEAMESGATVVTAGRRLARALAERFDERMRARGAASWPSPDVLPYGPWVRRTWEGAVVAGALPAPALLLGDAQESMLWRRIVSGQAASALLRPQSAAEGVRHAWRLARAWGLDPRDDAFDATEDTRAFRTWALAFEAHCAQRNWVAEPMLAARVRDWLDAADHAPPQALVLAGFDLLEPTQAALFEALARAGCAVHRAAPPETVGAAATRLPAVDSRDEAERAARWAAARLSADPQARIAIVTPDLEQRREMIVGALRRAIAPASLVPGAADAPVSWNVSLGPPLGTYPLVAAGLGLLGLALAPLELEHVGPLLLSAHLEHSAEERDGRARLDARLRERGRPRTGLGALAHAAADLAPHLAGRLEALFLARRGWPRSASPSAWSERFDAALRAAGWARGHVLSSAEYQTLEAWRALLADFAALDILGAPMTAADALSELRQMAGQRVFQPEGTPAPVQVLGLFETEGLAFDHLWVMGLHDRAWPPSPRPDPFLPFALQRRLGMPRASVERELEVTRAMTQRLARAAAEVVLSHPLQEETETLQPSPLITDFPEGAGFAAPAARPAGGWREAVRRSAVLDVVRADPVPRFAAARVRGGSRVFRDQALCPFRAYAEHRLGAIELGGARGVLDARERGTLVHRALETFWRETRSLAGLHALEPGALTARVRRHVEAALDEARTTGPEAPASRLLEIERERLSALLLAWLEHEQGRADFGVAEVEHLIEREIGGVPVRLRIDRIDRLREPEARRVLIDYKTGRANPAGWDGERPDDPQLPLYAVALDAPADRLAAVLYAHVHPENLRWRGAAADADVVPGVAGLTEDDLPWGTRLRTWHAAMEALGRAFVEGRAEVSPKRGLATCEEIACALSAFCRIHESLREASAAPDESDR